MGFWSLVESDVVDLVRKLLAPLGDDSEAGDPSFSLEDDVFDLVLVHLSIVFHLCQ